MWADAQDRLAQAQSEPPACLGSPGATPTTHAHKPPSRGPAPTLGSQSEKPQVLAGLLGSRGSGVERGVPRWGVGFPWWGVGVPVWGVGSVALLWAVGPTPRKEETQTLGALGRLGGPG